MTPQSFLLILTCAGIAPAIQFAFGAPWRVCLGGFLAGACAGLAWVAVMA